MRPPPLSLPAGLSFQTVSQRLAEEGFCFIMRNQHEGVTLKGVRGSFLVVTEEELGQIRELAKEVDTARKRLHRGHKSGVSKTEEEERTARVVELKGRKIALLESLQGQFADRVQRAVRRSDWIHEDYFTRVFPEPASLPISLAASSASSPASSAVAPELEDEEAEQEWVVLNPADPPLETLPAASDRKRESCCVQ